MAASFATGIFVTALPTGGLGIGLFFVLCSLWAWVSKPAIFASVAVLNPFVKPAVYVASFQLGGVVLATGPILASLSGLSTEYAGAAVGLPPGDRRSFRIASAGVARSPLRPPPIPVTEPTVQETNKHL